MTTTQRWAVYLVFLVIYTHTAQPCIIILHCMFRGCRAATARRWAYRSLSRSSQQIRTLCRWAFGNQTRMYRPFAVSHLVLPQVVKQHVVPPDLLTQLRVAQVEAAAAAAAAAAMPTGKAAVGGSAGKGARKDGGEELLRTTSVRFRVVEYFFLSAGCGRACACVLCTPKHCRALQTSPALLSPRFRTSPRR